MANAEGRRDAATTSVLDGRSGRTDAAAAGTTRDPLPDGGHGGDLDDTCSGSAPKVERKKLIRPSEGVVLEVSSDEVVDDEVLDGSDDVSK